MTSGSPASAYIPASEDKLGDKWDHLVLLGCCPTFRSVLKTLECPKQLLPDIVRFRDRDKAEVEQKPDQLRAQQAT